MTKLKDRLRADLSTAIKSRSTITVATLRMALSAITTEEVAAMVAAAIDDVAGQIGKPPGFGQLGLVMKAAMARAGGRAEGRRVSTAVLAALQR
ncbi:MAG TPA: GatB/YqeY domain-containing protein [Pseudonocardiaceae bacterium]|nr:GatB/YqeY domain-containing protein [Pseudonocardiaceae bacterium]